MDCPLCKNDLNLKIDTHYFHCTQCEALVKDRELWPDTSAEKERYLTHNNDVNDINYQNFTSPITNYILNNFKPHHSGLDFGSGTGPVISEMLKKQDYQIRQYDPYFANHPEVLEETYDYIFACEVVEHFYHPQEEFRRLRKMLKPGGALIMMTHLYSEEIPFESWYYRKDPTHVFIYTEPTFEFIRKKFDFKCLAIEKRLVVLKVDD
ncbi:class I SAM-dependent methyltransferase [Salinimicrobium xinjiangense]|uniref:class I SAM-dependent methyltransferase n=1 Tax=Salinimicrobium xinjiangense TaxID=438596 RepID=UPI00041321D8|nr:class I SAM-dependent methyltransferase [Salinimicrobium xinjiangense]